MNYRNGLVGVICMLLACTSPNPRSCSDGTCTDPSLPFCDVDGMLGGADSTCIAVDCTPNTFEACRGDLAITCNATGTDYDLVQCSKGCGAGGCTSCTTSSQCANPSPVCDTAQHECRSCTDDSECASAVCEMGSCVPEAMIVYADPMGVDSGNCTRPAPCALSRAVTLATSATTATLRLLPGVYTSLLSIAADTTIKVIATGTTLAGNGRLEVKKGNVDVRGLTVQSTVPNYNGVECGAATATTLPLPTLSLHGVTVFGSLAVYNGTIRVDTTTFSGIRVDDDGTLIADRVRMAGGDFLAIAKRLSVRVTNSQLNDVYVNFNTTDLATTNQFNFAFNTLVLTTASQGIGPIFCGSGASYAHVGQLENNIIVAPTGFDAVAGTSCTTVNNVLFPQSTARAGNVTADPQFVDATAKNYHLKMTSPARDMAVPTTGLSSDHDYEGTTRPQGSAPDIGAFEYKP